MNASNKDYFKNPFFILILVYICVLFISGIFLNGCGISSNQYQKQLTLWNDYKSKTNIIFNKYKEKITRKDKIFANFLLNYDYEKALDTAADIIEIYDDYLLSLKSITPPDFANSLHNYQLQSLELEQKKWNGILNDYTLYIEIDENLEAQIMETINSVNSEIKKINGLFLKEN